LADRSRLIVVSNRLPVTLTGGEEEGWRLEPGSGGLVTALAPVLSHRGGLWIGWPGQAVEPGGDWEAVLHEGFREQGYDLAPVLLSEEEVDGFYYGFSNSVLWPLFHDLATACDFNPSFWYAYLGVNRKFAAAVVERSAAGDFVWVQDYQLIHAAEQVRERGADRRLGFFLHIPFPPPDIFQRLPWRGQVLAALLAYDLIGFQTLRDLRNFLACADRWLPDVEVGEENGGVATLAIGDRELAAGAFPIGIDYRAFHATATSEDTRRRMNELRVRLGNRRIVLGVDRLDYTKGLPERLLAFEKALERHPGLREEVVLVQLVVPSRENVPEYRELKSRLDELVGRINGRYSTAGWAPVHYLYRSLPRQDLVALYRLARVGFVTSLKDGMNLVAKEFCACQSDDDPGALVLSEFAGAAAQLADGALVVNPHHVEETADVLAGALELPVDERRRRSEAMRRVIAEQDIFWWVERFLGVALGDGAEMLETLRDYVPRLDTADSWAAV